MTQTLTEIDYIEIARKVARRKSEPWHDTDDIEGYIVLQMVKRKPQLRHHALRVARNAKVDWIRKERGAKGQKVAIRNTYELDQAEDIESITDKVDIHFGFLTERQKLVLVMIHEGYRHRDIGERLGVSTYVVAKIARETRELLAQYMREQNG